MKYIHLLLSNLIGQNLQAMVQVATCTCMTCTTSTVDGSCMSMYMLYLYREPIRMQC